MLQSIQLERKLTRRASTWTLFCVLLLGFCWSLYAAPLPQSDFLGYWQTTYWPLAYLKGGVVALAAPIFNGLGFSAHLAAYALWAGLLALWAVRQRKGASRLFQTAVALLTVTHSPLYGSDAAAAILLGWAIDESADGERPFGQLLLAVMTRVSLLPLALVLAVTARRARLWLALAVLAGGTADFFLGRVSVQQTQRALHESITFYTGLGLCPGDDVPCGGWNAACIPLVQADSGSDPWGRIAQRGALSWITFFGCKFNRMFWARDAGLKWTGKAATAQIEGLRWAEAFWTGCIRLGLLLSAYAAYRNGQLKAMLLLVVAALAPHVLLEWQDRYVLPCWVCLAAIGVGRVRASTE